MPVVLIPGPLFCEPRFYLVGGDCIAQSGAVVPELDCPSGSFADFDSRCRKPVANARGNFVCDDANDILSGTECAIPVDHGVADFVTCSAGQLIGDTGLCQIEAPTVIDGVRCPGAAVFDNAQNICTFDLEPKQGDANCNGIVDVLDALLIIRYDVEILGDSATCPLDPLVNINAALADVNGDGLANSIDALLIARCEAGLDLERCNN